MRAGIVASVRQIVACRGERLCRRTLRLLRRICGRLCGAHLRFGRGGGAFGLVRRSRRIAPASEDQPRLGSADLVGQLAIAFGLPRLPPERGDLAVEPGHQILQPRQIGLGLAQLAFGILAPDMQPRDARRFFQHHPAFGGLGRDHLRDLALADERGAVRAGRGIGEGQRDILGPHIAAVEAIGAACAAFDPADHFQFVARIVRAAQHDFGEIARRAGFGAGEDHVFHPARAHGFGRVFAHDPADRLEQIGFPAAIGADDAGQPGFDAQFGRLDEALEAAQPELAYEHRRSAPLLLSA